MRLTVINAYDDGTWYTLNRNTDEDIYKCVRFRNVESFGESDGQTKPPREPEEHDTLKVSPVTLKYVSNDVFKNQ